MLSNGPPHLFALGCVNRSLLIGRLGRSQSLDADGHTRLVHEGENLPPTLTLLAQQDRRRPVKRQSAGGRAGDGDLVFGSLHDVVVSSLALALNHAVGQEEAEAVEPRRSCLAPGQNDREVPQSIGDELLPSTEPPGAVDVGRRGGQTPHIGTGLRLGHGDRSADLARRKPRNVALLDLFGAEAEDHQRRAHVERVLDHGAGVSPGQNLQQHGRGGKGEILAAVPAGNADARHAQLDQPVEIGS